MLKIDASTKQLVPVSATTLSQSKILERADLQAAIKTSWDSFAAELGYDELFLVGSEVVPHESCMDRIDLLGLSRDGTPIVFELKETPGQAPTPPGDLLRRDGRQVERQALP